MKIIWNPFFWIVLGVLVFAGLLITDTPSDSVLAAVLFLPCLLMAILSGMGLFRKFLK